MSEAEELAAWLTSGAGPAPRPWNVARDEAKLERIAQYLRAYALIEVTIAACGFAANVVSATTRKQ